MIAKANGHFSTLLTAGVIFALVIGTVSPALSTLAKPAFEPNTVDLRQAGAIQISGDLYEGGKVYLTFSVRNYGSTPSPPVHPYTEGYTSQGNLWRADGAQPTAVVIQPGQTVNFRVEHDLWFGHTGVWSTYGVYLWNDGNYTYFGPLGSNGYDQSISFTVNSTRVDLRQDGPIEVFGTLFAGGKVYLRIPVKNFGSEPSPRVHVYTEGYTSREKLWRADGAQPTNVTIQPGQREIFQVEHDLWYGHTGDWSTYGVYIWNDQDSNYYRPLSANGNNQAIRFNVASAPLQSLDIKFDGNSGQAIEVEYDVLDTLADGSVVVDLTVINKLAVPYMLQVWTFGNVSDPEHKLSRLEDITQQETIPLLPETSVTFRNVRFQYGSWIEFHYSMFGLDDQDRNFMYAVHAVEVICVSVFGFVPVGDMFKSFDSLINGGLDEFDKIEGLDFAQFGYAIGKGDIPEAVRELADLAGEYADELSQLTAVFLKTPISPSLIKGISFVARMWDAGRYLIDLMRGIGFAKVTLRPSSRPQESGTSTVLLKVSDQLLNSPQNLALVQNGAEILFQSSEQGDLWQPLHIADGDSATSWSTGSDTAANEWIEIRLAEHTPVLIESILINPGPTSGDHLGAALKDFHLETSIDGLSYTIILEGTFTPEELGETKTFAIPSTAAEYIRLVVESNQSDNSVLYVDVAELAVYGSGYSTADAYEPDTSVELARRTFPGNFKQNHSFHHPGDEDWLELSVRTGEHISILFEQGAMNASLILDIYGQDGVTLKESIALQPDQQLIWTAPETGTVYYKFFHPDPSAFGQETAYLLTLSYPSNFLPLTIRNFSSIPDLLPYPPGDPMPADDSSNQLLNTTLQWSGGDPDGDALTYDIKLGTDPRMLNRVGSTNIEIYTTGSLEANSTYYWQIVSRDGRGGIVSGPVWHFTTMGILNTPTAYPTRTSTPIPTSTPAPTATPLPPPPPNEVLLGASTNNGGFEMGNMTGWTINNGSVDVNTEFPRSGSYSVNGSSAGDESEGQSPVVFYQDLPLASYQPWIDAGLATANYEGWLHNGNSEYYRYLVHFYNQAGIETRSPFDTGWIRNAGGGYRQHAGQNLIPVETTYARVEVRIKRTSGSYTDVDVDDLLFLISFSAP